MAPLSVSPESPDRNLALELVRVTEAAAMAAGRWVGRGDKNGADGVAVNAMRVMISTIGMNGPVSTNGIAASAPNRPSQAALPVTRNTWTATPIDDIVLPTVEIV